MGGLWRYVPAFQDNGVDLDVIPELTEFDLQQMSIPVGARRKILAAARAHA
eukprot:NODE_10625_length_329_cov_38.282143_g9713_i0.p2 GENE.NODE_10625_length_329_cov_38.282143_g9713_i0~~NODE_10625_length_329_cov_38.282143_g9713_i0.p2  ORF type:complete len:59 (-),score=14.39 NODE_10625_length_329_cov_38.282143_g9713_i0:153-305(-)